MTTARHCPAAVSTGTAASPRGGLGWERAPLLLECAWGLRNTLFPKYPCSIPWFSPPPLLPPPLPPPASFPCPHPTRLPSRDSLPPVGAGGRCNHHMAASRGSRRSWEHAWPNFQPPPAAAATTSSPGIKRESKLNTQVPAQLGFPGCLALGSEIY